MDIHLLTFRLTVITTGSSSIKTLVLLVAAYPLLSALPEEALVTFKPGL